MEFSGTPINRSFSLTVVLPGILSLLIVAVAPVSLRAPAQMVKAAGGAPATTTAPDEATRARVEEAFARLPLSFEANAGQVDRRVQFLSRGPGYILFLTSTEAVFSLKTPKSKVQSPKSGSRTPDSLLTLQTPVSSAVLRMKLVGANPQPQADGLEPLPFKTNYFIGNDPRKWRTDVASYAKVRYHEVYRGIDIVYYGNQRQLEYDFVVAPGADPRQIKVGYAGAERVRVEDEELVVEVGGSHVRQRRPVVYQELEGGERREVRSGYRLLGGGSVGFSLGEYDASRPLIIDPVLVYSTYLGGSGANEQGLGIAVDSAGNAYVTGRVTSTNFPTTPGAFDTSYNNFFDAFVTKLDATGSSLVYSTFLGGSNHHDQGFGIAVDSAGSAYVTGNTFSADFPTTPGAFDTTLGNEDAFITKLDPTGSSLVYSTLLGGSGSQQGFGIAVDSAGSAYVTGNMNSLMGFPTTPGAFDTTTNGGTDVFVTKLDVTGSSLIYATFLGSGGSDVGRGIAVDSAGNAYVTGQTRIGLSIGFPTTPGAFDTTTNGTDVFVTKLDAAGSNLLYSTYLGGKEDDFGFGIAVDSAGSAYVTGQTVSTDFPTTPGAFDTSHNGALDAFVTKLDAAGSSLVYSTFLGGSATGGFGSDVGRGIAVDSTGSAYVTGQTSSPDFPTTPDALDTTINSSADAFVTKLDAVGSSLINSTFLGGSSSDTGFGIAVDSAGNAYVTGETFSIDFPTTSGAFDTTLNGSSDAFVLKISDPDADSDGVPDPADNCPATSNPDQTDTDADGQGDACDPDDDNDGVADETDNCPLTSNSDQTDTDGDGQGDACDPDDDNDTVPDDADNCPLTANADQADTDADGQGDACDPDDDNDGVADSVDNCPLVANTDQTNTDGDAEGDVCDADDDNDGVLDGADNCQLVSNSDQANNDGDAQGDACDADDDNDTVPDDADNCPATPNPDQANSDGDGLGDACDPDDDNNGVNDEFDQCPGTPPGTMVNASGCPLAVNKDQCKNNGWKTLRRANNTRFKNQGDCIQYVNTGK